MVGPLKSGFNFNTRKGIARIDNEYIKSSESNPKLTKCYIHIAGLLLKIHEMMNEANLNIGILFCSRSKRLPCPRHHPVSAHQVIKCHDCASMWIKQA